MTKGDCNSSASLSANQDMYNKWLVIDYGLMEAIYIKDNTECSNISLRSRDIVRQLHIRKIKGDWHGHLLPSSSVPTLCLVMIITKNITKFIVTLLPVALKMYLFMVI